MFPDKGKYYFKKGTVEKMRPDFYFTSFNKLTPKFLTDNSIKGLLIDIDNTLCEHNNPNPHDEIAETLSMLRRAGVPCCLVSNNGKKRVEAFANSIGLKYIYKSGKPSGLGIRRGAKLIGVNPYDCAVVGDQIFTDIMAGRAAGAKTILVVPISEEEPFWIKLKRVFEKMVISTFESSGLTPQ